MYSSGSGDGWRRLVEEGTRGRAVIAFVDDKNTAQGPTAANFGPGFNGGPVTSVVEQASGPGLFTGNVTGPPPSLAQSVPGFKAEVRDRTGDALLPAHQSPNGTTVTPGPNDNGADITDLKITAKDSQTLAMSFTLAGDPLTAISQSPVHHTGATWLVTWHTHALKGGALDDFWFASANLDSQGKTSFLAGKPISVFGTGDPKAFQYSSQAGQNSVVSGAFSSSAKTVEIDVPHAAIGAATGGDVLYGLTGYTEQVNASTATAASVPAGSLTGSVAIFDSVDQTAPIDYQLAPAIAAAGAPSVPLLMGAALFIAAGVAARRRRRRPAM